MEVTVNLEGKQTMVHLNEPTAKHERELIEIMRDVYEKKDMPEAFYTIKLIQKRNEIIRELCPELNTVDKFDKLLKSDKDKLCEIVDKIVIGGQNQDFTATSNQP